MIFVFVDLVLRVRMIDMTTGKYKGVSHTYQVLFVLPLHR